MQPGWILCVVPQDAARPRTVTFRAPCFTSAKDPLIQLSVIVVAQPFGESLLENATSRATRGIFGSSCCFCNKLLTDYTARASVECCLKIVAALTNGVRALSITATRAGVFLVMLARLLIMFLRVISNDSFLEPRRFVPNGRALPRQMPPGSGLSKARTCLIDLGIASIVRFSLT